MTPEIENIVQYINESLECLNKNRDYSNSYSWGSIDAHKDILNFIKAHDSTQVLKTSEEWCKHFNLRLGYDILDPDGWRGVKFDKMKIDCFTEEKITEEEFNQRVFQSTCRLSHDFFKHGIFLRGENHD